MRRLTFVLICLCALPAAAQQATPAPPKQAAPASGQAKPPADQAAPPSGSAGADTSPSLFEHVPNQAEIGGRLTTISGDPARFQRYGDFRDGLLFTGLRFGREEPTGFDTSIKASSTGGPEPYAHSRTNRDDHDSRIFENTGEHVLRFGARRAPPSFRPTANPATHGSSTVDASVAKTASVPPR